MSESEKQIRDEHQKNRKKYLSVIAGVLAGLLLLTLIFSLVYRRKNKEIYVPYTQQGSAVYYAYLADNEFYDVDKLNGSHAYVAALIERMTSRFKYELQMGTDDAHYRYSYRVDAQMVITDSNTGAPIYNPTFELLPATEEEAEGSSLCIDKTVDIDYNFYNDKAKSFVSTYSLSGTSCELIVAMYVDVVGMSESFAEDNPNQYSIELRVPLNRATLKPSVRTSVPTSAQRILAKNENSATVFKVFSIIFGVLSVGAAAAFVVFYYKTADKHIDYARRVKKLISNYDSYIQKISNNFDASDYQTLYVADFSDMLSLRDTLQKPILTYENEDKTCTGFFITTPEKVMYLYEIKVEDDE